MQRHVRRFSPALIAFLAVLTLLPKPAGARNAGVEANTLTAACTGALVVTPGGTGSFTSRLQAPCVGLGFAYDSIQISVERYDLRTGAFEGLQYKDCFGVSSCSMPYSFTGGPDRFLVFATVWWKSTSGPWLFATPGVVVSSAPFCYGDTGEWPVTPVGTASTTVGCNLILDLVL